LAESMAHGAKDYGLGIKVYGFRAWNREHRVKSIELIRVMD